MAEFSRLIAAFRATFRERWMILKRRCEIHILSFVDLAVATIHLGRRGTNRTCGLIAPNDADYHFPTHRYKAFCCRKPDA